MRNCKQCNKDITHRHKRTIFCSDLCSKKWRRDNQPVLSCLRCNKNFKPLPYKTDHKFCSNLCSTRYTAKIRVHGQTNVKIATRANIRKV